MPGRWVGPSQGAGRWEGREEGNRSRKPPRGVPEARTAKRWNHGKTMKRIVKQTESGAGRGGGREAWSCLLTSMASGATSRTGQRTLMGSEKGAWDGRGPGLGVNTGCTRDVHGMPDRAADPPRCWQGHPRGPGKEPTRVLCVQLLRAKPDHIPIPQRNGLRATFPFRCFIKLCAGQGTEAQGLGADSARRPGRWGPGRATAGRSSGPMGWPDRGLDVPPGLALAIRHSRPSPLGSLGHSGQRARGEPSRAPAHAAHKPAGPQRVWCRQRGSERVGVGVDGAVSDFCSCHGARPAWLRG